MSHISEYKVKVKKMGLFVDICRDLGYEVREALENAALTVQQFGRNTVQAAVGVKIPGWGYEIAVTADGRIMYDHYGSQPNTIELLGKTLQRYNQEAILEDAWQTQNTVETLKNGDVKLILEF